MVALHVCRRPSFHRVRKTETDAMKMTVAQMLHHDHTKAKRQDDKMIPRAAGLVNPKYGGQQSSKGKGQWLTWDSRAMLRCTFEKRGNMSQLAKEYKSNHTQIRKTAESIAGLYVHLQHAAADRELIEAGQHDWLVMHLQWDGAKFTFKLDEGPPMVYEVLAQHGIVR